MEREQPSILVYVPRSNIITFILVGICFLSIAGFTLTSHQIVGWVFSALFFVAGCWMFTFPWRLIRTPTLVIDNTGIRSQHPFARWDINWDEIAAIYSITYGSAFAIDLSPEGLLSYFTRQRMRIPRWLDPTMPQQVCVTQGINLALPIDQLLAQIREKFAVQLENNHIVLDTSNTIN